MKKNNATRPNKAQKEELHAAVADLRSWFNVPIADSILNALRGGQISGDQVSEVVDKVERIRDEIEDLERMLPEPPKKSRSRSGKRMAKAA